MCNVHSEAEISEDFCLNNVQEFGLCTQERIHNDGRKLRVMKTHEMLTYSILYMENSLTNKENKTSWRRSYFFPLVALSEPIVIAVFYYPLGNCRILDLRCIPLGFLADFRSTRIL
jgi:hypothetical protein